MEGLGQPLIVIGQDRRSMSDRPERSEFDVEFRGRRVSRTRQVESLPGRTRLEMGSAAIGTTEEWEIEILQKTSEDFFRVANGTPKS